MTITVFSAYPFERPPLIEATQNQHEFNFLDEALTLETVEQAAGSVAEVVFFHDDAPAPMLG
jgi:D-lactate dehydrogenase